MNAEIAIEQGQYEKPAPLPLRDDTMLGICEAIGEDFGFHPNWLRLALGAGILVNPAAVVALYLGLGVVVAASRLVFPKPTPVLGRQAAVKPVQIEAPVAEQERERELIAA